ncbi:putative cytosol alanyl aminopeptidase [Helianthus anomalus]
MTVVMTHVLKVKLSTIQSKATSLILPRLELVYVVFMIFTLFLGTFRFLNETVLHVVVYLQQWSAIKDRLDIIAKYACRIVDDRSLLSNGNLIEQGDLEGVMKAAVNTRIPTSKSRIGANISHQCLSSSVSSLASTYIYFITNEYVHPLY